MNKRVNKRKIKQIFVFKIIMNNFLEIVTFDSWHTQAATISAFWGRKIFDAFSAVKSLFSKFSDAGGQGF